MATIKAFRGVRYNTAKVADLSTVISQPYDRVRYGLQERYYELSPYNVARIIKGKEPSSGHSVYAQARATYDRWRAERVLLRESSPALYVYHQTFAVAGQTRTRKALVAALQLTPFDEGTVLPHERTHAGPKMDRLQLMRALEVNTGQIFTLYPDPQNVVSAILDEAIAGRVPDVDAHEMYEEGVRQQLWVVRDLPTIQAVEREMAPKRNLIIADGHHRYETALYYRDERRAAGASPNAASGYCIAALVSMDDPGLVILPTHREVFGLSLVDVSGILARARSFFEVIPVPDLQGCLAEMQAAEPRHAFGLYAEGCYRVLVLKSLDRIAHWMAQDGSLARRSLDVSIAHEVLLEQVIGLSERAIVGEANLRYHRDPKLAIAHVDSGQGNLVLLLNPTRIDQVKTCAMQGVKMPSKSTDFYPKMVAGLTMMPVGEGEQL
jgi:uncharacterized protein (DUF1015 family)